MFYCAGVKALPAGEMFSLQLFRVFPEDLITSKDIHISDSPFITMDYLNGNFSFSSFLLMLLGIKRSFLQTIVSYSLIQMHRC